MAVSRRTKERLRNKYRHLYTPEAFARMHERNKPAKDSTLPISLPRGATLPKEPSVAPVYIHYADKPPRKLVGLELARYLREEAIKRGDRWPLA